MGEVSVCTTPVELWEWNRMEKHLVEHGSHTSTSDTTLSGSLSDLSDKATRSKTTQKIVHRIIVPDTVGHRGQATWWICRWYRITAILKLPGLPQQVHHYATTQDQVSS